MTDRGYDSYMLIDYIYENEGGDPVIPSKKVLDLNDIVTGGNIRKDIWSRNFSSN